MLELIEKHSFSIKFLCGLALYYKPQNRIHSNLDLEPKSVFQV